MKNKENSKGLDLVKKIGYLLIIMLIFTPLSFLISNTITGDSLDRYSSNCYPDYYAEPDMNPEEQKINQEEIQLCEKEHTTKLQKHDTEQFIIISILSFK